MVVAAVCVSAPAAEFSLTLGHGAAPDNPRHLMAKEFADAILERTGGRVEVEVYHSESLGSDRQMLQSLMLGKLDMSINSHGPVAAFLDNLNVIGLPFLFANPEQAYTLLDGELGRELVKPLERKNMKILAFWDNGFRHFTNNVKPITKPADMDGLKIRTPEDSLTINFVEALGASAIPFAFGELYEALGEGVFDGQENAIPNIYYSKLYEVQRYLSLTNHKYESCPFVISMRTWRMLPKDLTAIIEDTAVEYAMKHRELTNNVNRELLEKMSDVMEVNEVDVMEFRAASNSVYDQFINQHKGARALLDRVRNYTE